jgi:hypothetical protein
VPTATEGTKDARVDLGWTFRLLSALMTTLALVALARHAFATWSLSAPMQLVIDAYSATTRLLFGWAEPYLQAALTWLGDLIGWRPTLSPHWRDVFVLLALWSTGWSRGLRHEGRPWLSFAVSGVVGSIIAALLVGVEPEYGRDTRLIPFLIVTGLLWAYAMWGSGTWRSRGIVTGVIACAVLFVFGTMYWARLSAPFEVSSGLVIVLVAVSCTAFGMVMGGLDQRLNRPTSSRTRAIAATGVTILGGFAGAFCFFAIDAGLKLLGA